tara:strand:- start:32 stop:445 length:414 start_codon:yes stop_codon:yes gene_type:complete
MAFCTSCGSELVAGMGFCGSCGSKLGEPASDLDGTQNIINSPPQYSPTPQTIFIQQAPSATKSGGLAIVLAFVWPGLDRLYLEDTRAGLIAAISSPLLVFSILGIPIFLVLWIHSVATASKRVREFNHNMESLQNRP